MKPIVNLEENIGKTVGKRVPPDPLKIQPGEVTTAEEWSKVFRRMRGVRPGVYRFHSHEEADAWLMKYTIQRDPT